MLEKIAKMSDSELEKIVRDEKEETFRHYPDEKFCIYKEDGSYHKEYDDLEDLLNDAVKHRKNYSFQASFSMIDESHNIFVGSDASDKYLKASMRKAFIHLTNDWSVQKPGWRQVAELVFFNKRDEITFEFTYTNGCAGD